MAGEDAPISGSATFGGGSFAVRKPDEPPAASRPRSRCSPKSQGTGVFPFAPLQLVLPRCTAATVSGALRSFAAAMRAGLPTVVAPQLFDQVWNGRRLETLGTGAVARRPERIAPAMRQLLADPDVRGRAEVLAARMTEEDGASACADAVEEVLAGTGR